MAFVKGDTVILSIWDGVDSYDPVACLTSNEISLTKNMIESQTKCSPGKIVKTPSSKDYEITFEAETETGGSNTTTFAILFAAQQAGTAVEWQISNLDEASASYYGTGYITDLSSAAPSGDELLTFSGTIVGDGVLDITTTAPNP